MSTMLYSLFTFYVFILDWIDLPPIVFSHKIQHMGQGYDASEFIAMTKIIKTCTKPLQRGHRKLHFYAPNNVCSHMSKPGVISTVEPRLTNTSLERTLHPGPMGVRWRGVLLYFHSTKHSTMPGDFFSTVQDPLECVNVFSYKETSLPVSCGRLQNWQARVGAWPKEP